MNVLVSVFHMSVRPRGWFSPDGTATMLMPNVEKGTFRELLFHEVGGHGDFAQVFQIDVF